MKLSVNEAQRRAESDRYGSFTVDVADLAPMLNSLPIKRT